MSSIFAYLTDIGLFLEGKVDTAAIRLGTFFWKVTLTYIREAYNERSHRNFPSSLGDFANGHRNLERPG